MQVLVRALGGHAQHDRARIQTEALAQRIAVAGGERGRGGGQDAQRSDVELLDVQAQRRGDVVARGLRDREDPRRAAPDERHERAHHRAEARPRRLRVVNPDHIEDRRHRRHARMHERCQVGKPTDDVEPAPARIEADSHELVPQMPGRADAGHGQAHPSHLRSPRLLRNPVWSRGSDPRRQLDPGLDRHQVRQQLARIRAGTTGILDEIGEVEADAESQGDPAGTTDDGEATMAMMPPS